MIVDGTQVLDDAWSSRLNVARRDAGTGMTADEVDELSARVRLPSLLAYWRAVGERTADVVDSLSPADLDEIVGVDRAHRFATQTTAQPARRGWSICGRTPPGATSWCGSRSPRDGRPSPARPTSTNEPDGGAHRTWNDQSTCRTPLSSFCVSRDPQVAPLVDELIVEIRDYVNSETARQRSISTDRVITGRNVPVRVEPQPRRLATSGTKTSLMLEGRCGGCRSVQSAGRRAGADVPSRAR